MKSFLIGLILGSAITFLFFVFFFPKGEILKKTEVAKEDFETIHLPITDRFLSGEETEVPLGIKGLLISNYQDDFGNYEIPNCSADELANNGEYEFDSGRVDLNSDGEDEYIIIPFKVCEQIIRGASGNGPIYVFQKINGNWERIGLLEGNGYFISEEKTNGYSDILTNWHSSAASGARTLYKYFNKSDSQQYGAYEMVLTKHYDDTRN